MQNPFLSGAGPINMPGSGNPFSGSPARMERFSNLDPEQKGLYDQLISASQGGFGQATNYYKDLLSNDSQTFNQMAAPEMRRFREQILPDISNQLAGMHGYQSSSAREQLGSRAGVDLAERLGSMRAQLRQQGAEGLTGIGNKALGQFGQNVYFPREQGLMDSLPDILIKLLPLLI